ncbi:cardiolipin synthase [Nitrosospira multiformis]|uniref:Cardiolipin synthase n=1 Tax=Nitrosospira multiformis TaxID=1231 RepID=A0A2T5I313_9PROT|nr:cardiolipin synthase [Nitrosospira multiformis]PTQ78229.1 cardiolipin synthase [Nitrosospira multiformis]
MNVPLWSVILVSVVTAVIFGLILVIFGRNEKEITHRVSHLYPVSDPQFLRSMGVLLGPALVRGNRVETLLNGNEIFPAMLKAIREAEKTITFETYIYWSGAIGRKFAETLSEKARQGVRVHVLLDWVGSEKMEEASIQTMRDAGVEIEKYHPPTWRTWRRINNRTHRKILVLDGKTGFTGGVGIADEWLGDAQGPDNWRDTHYRIEGPVVAQLQAAFADNWTKVKGSVLHGGEYFPELKEHGSNLAQVFKSSIEGGAESMHLMYLLSIAAAKKSIHLSMAYFVPDALARDAMVAALKRGVRIQIILPSRYIDKPLVRSASRGTWGVLLRSGAEIYEFQPTMYHCKLLIVDELWVSVGSTNFDSRSFKLNDESNLNVYNQEFAERQVADFKVDLTRSRQITFKEWESRPLTEKAWEYSLKIIRPQL